MINGGSYKNIFASPRRDLLSVIIVYSLNVIIVID